MSEGSDQTRRYCVGSCNYSSFLGGYLCSTRCMKLIRNEGVGRVQTWITYVCRRECDLVAKGKNIGNTHRSSSPQGQSMLSEG